MIHNKRLNAIGQKILSPISRDDFTQSRDRLSKDDKAKASDGLKTLTLFLTLCEKDADGLPIDEAEIAQIEDRLVRRG